MSPFLFRLIVAIYVLAGFPAFILTGGVNGTLKAFLTLDLILGSIVVVPVLLVAWVAAGLRQRS